MSKGPVGKAVRRKGYRRVGILAPRDDVTIYAVSCSTYIKIGIARNVTMRLRELQVGNPFLLRVVARHRIAHEAAANAEYLAHCALADRHHRGEWFEVTTAEARAAIRAAVRQSKPTTPPDAEAIALWEHEGAKLARVAEAAMRKIFEGPILCQGLPGDAYAPDKPEEI